MNAENAGAFFCPELLYLLHNPQGCGECREMTGSFPVRAGVHAFVVNINFKWVLLNLTQVREDDA
ncbi:hypothetical protein [Methylobacter sp.]|uniref:hypothetical protein n=1 Tax=Methylobacter sp. TaxID=2051955 RepID=UPI0027308896|nr:hypothetical protein [Methylobacter sp.]